jgi:hypothetical protein
VTAYVLAENGDMAAALVRDHLEILAMNNIPCGCVPFGMHPDTGDDASDQCPLHTAVGLLAPTHHVEASEVPW